MEAESSREPLAYRNLAAIWSIFAAVGASRLLLACLVKRRFELQRVPEAVPGAIVTVVRLHAPLEVLERRLRAREPGSPDAELDGARWWARHFDAEKPEDHLVETDERPVRDIASDVLRLAGWLT